MGVIDIRMSGEQLALLVDALATVTKDHPGDQRTAEWQEMGAWLTHRYTRRWGLPPTAATALERLRSARKDC